MPLFINIIEVFICFLMVVTFIFQYILLRQYPILITKIFLFSIIGMVISLMMAVILKIKGYEFDAFAFASVLSVFVVLFLGTISPIAKMQEEFRRNNAKLDKPTEV